MRQLLSILALLITTVMAANGQSRALKTYSLNASTGTITPSIPGNAISHLTTEMNTVWIGTGKGLARSTNSGISWESFGAVPQFANPGIFSLAVSGDTIWAATGYNKDVEGSSVQTGSGYTVSTDNGGTWTGLPQTMDTQADTIVVYGINRVRFLPIVVPEQNVTFDVAMTSGAVWIASWSSGIRHSTDLGRTWQRTVLPARGRSTIAPTDSLGTYLVDPRNDNNFLGFAVCAQNDSTIWAGTAGGVNKSTDGGASWVNLTYENQVKHIAANWVIAIAAQALGNGTRIWTTNWPTDIQGERYGVSYTDDGGRTWTTALPDVKAYAFAFKDSIVYVASESGLFRSDDKAQSWTQSGTIIDQATGNRVATDIFYSVGVIGDTVFGGTADGLVKTVDNATHPFGAAWSVMRAYQPVGSSAVTYAYPNPFSPHFDISRIHYNTDPAGGNVTIELFDFGMNRVRTVVKDVQRSAGEHDEIWDGTTDGGKTVPSGVYFYRVIVNGGDPAWGKIMVIQ